MPKGKSVKNFVTAMGVGQFPATEEDKPMKPRIWCEHCHGHYEGSHYGVIDNVEQHLAGMEYGPYGILLERRSEHGRMEAALKEIIEVNRGTKSGRSYRTVNIAQNALPKEE